MSVSLGSAYLQTGVDTSGLDRGLQQASGQIQGWAGQATSSFQRVGEVALGVLVGQAIPRLIQGFSNLGRQAIDAAASYQSMQVGMEGLLARELSKGQEVIRTRQVLAETTGNQSQKLTELSHKQDLLNAQYQEESERHRQLTLRWGENGLAVQTHAAKMAILKDKVDDNAAAMAALSGKTSQYVTVTEKVKIGVKTIGEVMPQAQAKAKQLMDELARIAIVSPYQLQNVQATFKQAMAFGYTSTEATKFTKAMLNVGAGVGAGNEQLNRMAYNFAQIRMVGKVTALDIRQLAMAGFDLVSVLQFAGQKFKVNINTYEDFNKAIAAGKITWEQFTDAFAEYADTNFGGASERMARTIQGLKSTFSDLFALTMPQVVGPALEMVTGRMNRLLDIFLSVRESGALEAFGAKLAQAAERALGPLDRLLGYLDQVKQRSKGAAGVGSIGAVRVDQTQTDMLSGALTAMLGPSAAGAAQQIQDAVNGVATAFLAVKNAAVSVWETLQPLVTNVAAWIGQYVQLKDVVAAFAILLLSAAVPAIAGLVSGFLAFAAPIAAVIGAVAALRYAWEQDLGGIQEKFNGFKGALEILVASFSGNFDAIRGRLPELQQGIDSVFGAGATGKIMAFGRDLGIAVEAIKGKFGELVNAFQVGGLPAVGAKLGEWANGIVAYVQMNAPIWGAAIKAKLGEWWNGIVTFFQTNAPIWGATIQAQVAKIWTGLTTFSTGTSTALTGFGQFVQQVQGIWQRLVDFFGPTVERIKVAFTSLGAQWDALAPKFAALWNVVKPILEKMGIVVAAVLGVIIKLLGETLASVIANAGRVIGGLVDMLTGNLQAISGIVSGAVEVVKNLLEGDWAGAWEAAKGTVTALLEGLQLVWQGAVEILDGLMGAIWDALVNTLNDILGTSLPKWDEFKAGIATAVQGIADAVAEKFTAIKDDIIAKVTGIVDGVKALYTRFTEAGKAIVDGLWEGLRGAWAGMLGKFRELVDKLPDSIKHILGIASPSKVFAEIGGQIVAGLVIGIEGERMEAIQAMTSTVQGVVQAVLGLVQTLTALTALRLGTAWQENFKAVSAAMSEILTALQHADFALRQGGIDYVKLNEFAQAAGAVLSTISSLANIARTLSGAKIGWDAVHKNISGLMDALLLIGKGFSSLLPQLPDVGPVLGIFADSLTAVLGAVDKAVGMLRALSNLTGWLARNSPRASFEALSGTLQWLAASIGQMAKTLGSIALKTDGDLLAAAREFAEATGPVLSLFDDALTTLLKLAQWSDLHGLSGAIDNIAHWLRIIAITTGTIAEQVGPDLLASAADFAKAAGPIVDLFGDALTTLLKLAQWDDLHGLSGAIDNIAHWLRIIATTTGIIAEQVGADLLASAADFADVAGPVVKLFDGALETLLALTRWTDLHGLSGAINNIAHWLRIMATTAGIIAEQIGPALLVAAGDFAAVAGPVVNLFTQAMTLISDLANFRMPAGLSGKSGQWDGATGRAAASGSVWEQLGAMLYAMTQALTYWSEQLAPQAQAAARVFVDGLGPVIEFVNQAVEVLVKLSRLTIPDGLLPGQNDRDWRMPSPFTSGSIWDRLGAAFYAMTQALTYWAHQLTPQAQAAARAFAEGVEPVVEMVGKAIDVLARLAKLTIPAKLQAPRAAGDWRVPSPFGSGSIWDQLGAALYEMTQALSYWANQLTPQAQAAARAFADGLGPVLEMVGKAVDVLASIATLTIPARLQGTQGERDWRVPSPFTSGSVWDQLGAALYAMTEALAYWAHKLTPQAQEAARAFADGLVPVLEMVGKAVDVLTALTDWKAAEDLSERADKLIAALGYVLQKISDLAGHMGALIDDVLLDMVAGAGEIADGLRKVIGFFTDLGLWKPVANLSEQVDVLMAQVGYLFSKLRQLVRNWDSEGLTLVNQFATALGAVMTGLQAALTLALALPSTWTGPNQGAWDAFFGWATATFERFVAKVREWTADYGGTDRDALIGGDATTVIGAVAGAFSAVMTGLKSALDLALALPQDWDAPDPAVWDAFFAWATGAFAQFVAKVKEWTKSYGGAGIAVPALFEGDDTTVIGAVAAAFGAVMQGLQAALTLALALPETWAAPTQTTWDAFFDWTTAIFAQFVAKVREWTANQSDPTAEASVVGAVAGAFGAVMQGLQAALTLFTGLEAFIAPVESKINELLARVIHTYEVILAYATDPLITATAAVVTVFATAAQAVFSSLSTGLTLYQDLADSTPTSFDAFEVRITALLDRVFTTIDEFVTRSADAPEWTAAAEAFKNALTKVAAVLNEALGLLTGLQEGKLPSTAQINAFIAAVVNLFVRVTTEAVRALEAAEGDITAAVAAMLDAVAELADRAGEIGKQLAAALLAGLTGGVTEQILTVTAAVAELAGSAAEAAAAGLLDTVAAQVSRDLEIGKTIGAAIIDGVVNSLKAGLADVTAAVAQTARAAAETAITEVLDAVAKQVGRAAGVGNRIGAAIVSGIAAGIRAGLAEVTAAVKTVADAAATTAEAELQIASPSQRMFDLFRMVPAGAAAGILAGVPDVADSMSALAGVMPTMPVLGAVGGQVDVAQERRVVIEFRGDTASGGVPLEPWQFEMLKRELVNAVQLGA